jgi:hypothetical protein
MEVKDIRVDQLEDSSHTRVVFEQRLILLQQRNVLADLLIGVEKNVKGVGPSACYLKRKDELIYSSQPGLEVAM